MRGEPFSWESVAYHFQGTGTLPAETLPGAKHARIPRNVTVPKASAKSRCGWLRAAVTFGTVQA